MPDNKTNSIHIDIFDIECPQEGDLRISDPEGHATVKLRARGQKGSTSSINTNLYFYEPDALLELANLLERAATEMQDTRHQEGGL